MRAYDPRIDEIKARAVEMIGKIIAAVFVILVCAVVSMALFPPGNVLRQISLVVIWYLAGASTGAACATRSGVMLCRARDEYYRQHRIIVCKRDDRFNKTNHEMVVREISRMIKSGELQ